MTPEAKAREMIDAKLTQAGWCVQDLRQLDLAARPGIAVREYPTDTGPTDYVLFLNRQAVGVIEAKRDDAGVNLTDTEAQTAHYANAALKWRKDDSPLPFLFEATGQIIRFTDGRDPLPRSREVFHFFWPAQLGEWLAQPDTLRGRLAAGLPALATAAQRKNILQAAFSGQLVPQDPSDEPASVLLAHIRAERAAEVGNKMATRSRRKAMQAP